MDYLDAVDAESTHTRSHRVRSWYLYEQYRSLERNQLDATQKLKDKSYQGALLQQELSERRLRRRICGDCGGSDSERLSSMGDIRSCFTSSDNNFYESFCEMHDDVAPPPADRAARAAPPPADRDLDAASERSQPTADSRDTADDYDSEYKQNYHDEYDDELKEDSVKSISPISYISKAKSNTSLVYRAIASSANLADDIKEELEQVKRNIEENINIQRETVKDNLQCCREFSKLAEESKEDSSSTKCDQSSSKYGDECDEESVGSLQLCDTSREEDDSLRNAYSLWSKIVSFAYQVIQLNHGNCYYDYSSQFLTAVLAFDVLRRGINKMCEFLQPYVSPIKYNDTGQCITRQSRYSKELSSLVERTRHCFTNKNHTKHRSGVRRASEKSPCPIKKRFNGEKPCLSETIWRPPNNKRVKENTFHIFSESDPWESAVFARGSFQASGGRPSTIWPADFASCRSHVRNPMAKLATYIDNVLENENSATNL